MNDRLQNLKIALENAEEQFRLAWKEINEASEQAKKELKGE